MAFFQLLLFVQTFFFIQAEKLCKTAECTALADELIHRSLKQSVEPCEDFYEHVCGNFQASNPVPENRLWWSNYDKRGDSVQADVIKAMKAAASKINGSHLVKFAAQFYLDCSDTETIQSRGVQPLLKAVDSMVGGFPLLRKSNHSSNANWTRLLVDVNAKATLSPLIKISIQRDASHKLIIQHGDIAIPMLTFKFLNSEKLQAYKKHIREAAILMGAPDNVQLTHDVDKLVELESDLVKATYPEEDETPEKHSTTDWLSIVNEIFKEIGANLAPFKQIDMVDVQSVFNTYSKILDAADPAVVQNLFAWAIVLKYGDQTSEKLAKSLILFKNEILLNKRNSPSRSDYCLGMIDFHLPFVLSRIYVDAYFTAEDKKQAEILVHEIKSSFHKVLDDSSWLDSDTKKYAIEKLEAIKDNIAYPDWIMSNQELDDSFGYMKDVEAKSGKYFEVMLQMFARNVRNEFDRKYPSPIDKPPIWPFPPTEPNAMYLDATNSISIPAALLHPPFFHAKHPFAMNYGGIGSTIGHEYTHGFDSEGRKMDKNGQPHDWWTRETKNKFQEKVECFVKQYSEYHVPELMNATINGRRTLTENIADNGGIKESFQAYRTHEGKYGKSPLLPGLNYTSDQLFFVAYAINRCISYKSEISQTTLKELLNDEHSPDSARVNVVFGNTPQFAQAFNCKVNSPMNPEHKCAVW